MLNLNPATIFTRLLTLVIALSVHEFAHAWSANALGDDTPRQNGRLTLNPAVHLDLMGSLMVLFAGFGWARPVPVNAYALQRRSPAALMWVSLAGPMSNLLLAVLAAIPLRFGLVPYSFNSGGLFPTPFAFLVEFILINLSLMLFNLIPIAPLDGEKIAEYFFPPSWARFLDTIRPYGPLILLSVLFILPIVGIDLLRWVLRPVLSVLFNLLLGVPG